MLEHSGAGEIISGILLLINMLFFLYNLAVCIGLCVIVFFLFLKTKCFCLSGSEKGETVVGIENPAFDGGGGSTELSESPTWLGRNMRGDRPDSTLAAHQKKSELQAPAKERGEASFFIRLKTVDSRCVPDLTFLSLPLAFSCSLSPSEEPLVPGIPKQVCPNEQLSYNFLPLPPHSGGCSISI